MAAAQVQLSQKPTEVHETMLLLKTVNAELVDNNYTMHKQKRQRFTAVPFFMSNFYNVFYAN